MKKNLLTLCCLIFLVNNAYAETPVNNTSTAQNSSSQPVKTAKIAPEKKVDLQTIYKREFAFLQAQKNELSQRLRKFNATAKKDEIKLKNKIARLEQETVKKSGRLQEMDSLLQESERTKAALEERSEVLGMTYQQAESSLKNYKIDLGLDQIFQTGTDDKKVEVIFTEASQLLHKLSSLSSHEGEFYLHNGKQVKGKIIQLGNVASYGISSEGGGALVPAGGNQMKVWSIPTEDIAQSFADNNPAPQLKIFLYESRIKAIDEKAEKTWLSVIDSGGIIGWVIVSLGAFGLVLVVIRTVLLQMNNSASRTFEQTVISLVSNGKLGDAEKFCQQSKGAIARVLNSTLRHVKDDRDHMEDIITEAILYESGTLDKFSSTILVIAAVSPLLGLLGTVTGMIATFDIITEFGTGDPKLLSSGISVALVTTELGLIVAIPTLLMGTLLASWSESIKMDMEKVALKVTNIMLSHPNLNLASSSMSKEAA